MTAKKKILLFAPLLLLGLSSCWESDQQKDLNLRKQQVLERSEAITELKRQKVAKEGERGYLLNKDTADIARREIIQRENVDRKIFFGHLAGKYGVSTEDVAKVFAEKAKSADVQ